MRAAAKSRIAVCVYDPPFKRLRVRAICVLLLLNRANDHYTIRFLHKLVVIFDVKVLQNAC